MKIKLMLNNQKTKKLFIASLSISLIVIALALTVTFFNSDTGQQWLASYSSNGDCDRPDRPYWCEL